MNRPSVQMSESRRLAAILTLSGGLQDAYTYFSRNKVFANAQTGNIVLMSSHFFNGEWRDGFRYLIPLTAFALGVLAAEQIQARYRNVRAVHWRQIILLIEIIILFLSGFMPASLSIISTSLISFSCAMQVQAFRKIHGHAYASTMCIGNMRSGMAAFSAWIRTGDHDQLSMAFHYFLVIVIFAFGAGCGFLLVNAIGFHSIWISDLILLVAFFLMFIDTEKEEGNTTAAAMLEDLKEEEKEILHPGTH